MDIPVLKVNNVDSDQTPHSVASDHGLHYFLLTLFGGFPTKMGKFRFSVCNDQSLWLDCTCNVSYCS